MVEEETQQCNPVPFSADVNTSSLDMLSSQDKSREDEFHLTAKSL